MIMRLIVLLLVEVALVDWALDQSLQQEMLGERGKNTCHAEAGVNVSPW